MRVLLVIFSFIIPALSYSLTLEGRFLEKDKKCFIFVNETQLSGSMNIPVKCEMFLVDQYKYLFEINRGNCPYKVKKIQIIPPGVDPKVFKPSEDFKKCP